MTPLRTALTAPVLVLLVAIGLVGPGGAVGAAPGQDPATETSDPATTSVPVAEEPDPGAGCEQVVFDPAGRLPASPTLDAAIMHLVATGVDLRLRVVDRLPDPADIADLARTCDWTADGRRDPRLMVLGSTKW